MGKDGPKTDEKDVTLLILQKLEEIEKRMTQIELSTKQRMALIEENTKELMLEKRESEIRLQPVEGTPFVPNVFRENPYRGSIPLYNISHSAVDITPIINESLKDILRVLQKHVKDDALVDTSTISSEVELHRTTVSTRLNLLHTLGLTEKNRGKASMYRITPKGQRVLQN